MATIFDDAILASNGFVPTKTDTPLDKRTRIESIGEMPSIPNPYVGMLVYVSSEDKYYKVKTLKAKVLNGITVQNAQVDSYEEFKSGGSTGITQATETTLGGIKAASKTANETVEAKIDPETGKMFVPAGGMTTEQQNKLNSIESGANKTVVEQSVTNSATNVPSSNAVKKEVNTVKSTLNADITKNTSNISLLQTKVNALSGIDSPFVGYFDLASKLPAQTSPAWALVGDLATAKPYAYYISGNVPSGYVAGWNDLSGVLGTYDFTNLEKLNSLPIIPIVGFGYNTVTAGVSRVGEIFYNTKTNTLRECIEYNVSLPTESEYKDVPFINNALYVCGMDIYVYDGVKLVPFEKGNFSILESKYNIVDPKPTFTDGYIMIDGSIQSSTISQYSSPIFLKKGAIIVLGGFCNDIAVISLVDEQLTKIFPVVIAKVYSDDDIYMNYSYNTYTAIEDCYVSLCARKDRFQYYMFEPQQADNEFAGIIPTYTADKDFKTGYYDLSGNKASSLLSSNETHAFVCPIKENDRIIFIGGREGDLARSYAITDADGNILEQAKNSLGLIRRYDIIAPVNSAYIYFNTYANKKANVYIQGHKTESFSRFLNDAFEEVFNRSDLVAGYYPMDGDNIGPLTESTYTKSCKKSVKEGEIFIILGKAEGNKSRTYAVTDADGRILKKCDEILLEDLDESIIEVRIPKDGNMLYINNSIYKDFSVPLYQDNFWVFKSFISRYMKDVFGGKSQGYSFEFKTRSIEIPWNSTIKNNYALCCVKKLKENNSNPLNVGYYFNEYPAKNGKIYYGNTLLGKVEEIADFGNDVWIESRVVAVSPKHNSIITNVFDRYPGLGLKIYEDGNYSEVNFTEPMQAWLYNVGIEFVTDSNGKEYCIYGEYSHARKPTRRIFKGTYPYANKDNWKVVFEIPSQEGAADGILHIHHIQKDPWSNYMYCCCGDTDAESRWFYSSDLGETWNLLVKGLQVGYLRCTNVIFLENDIYWASDDYTHYLMHANRQTSGLLDTSSIKPICTLPSMQATNALAYVQQLDALFFYDRADTSKGILREYLYDIKAGEIKYLKDFNKMDGFPQPWGNRGKCYNHYPNTSEPLLAMGILEEYVPCSFDIPGNDQSTFGTIFYDIRELA